MHLTHIFIQLWEEPMNRVELSGRIYIILICIFLELPKDIKFIRYDQKVIPDAALKIKLSLLSVCQSFCYFRFRKKLKSGPKQTFAWMQRADDQNPEVPWPHHRWNGEWRVFGAFIHSSHVIGRTTAGCGNAVKSKG